MRQPLRAGQPRSTLANCQQGLQARRILRRSAAKQTSPRTLIEVGVAQDGHHALVALVDRPVEPLEGGVDLSQAQVALHDTDCLVADPIRLIRRLYRLESLADLRDYSPDQRAGRRQARSRPVFDRLKRWAVVTHATEPPSSELAKPQPTC